MEYELDKSLTEYKYTLFDKLEDKVYDDITISIIALVKIINRIYILSKKNNTYFFYNGIIRDLNIFVDKASKLVDFLESNEISNFIKKNNYLK